MTEWYDKCVNLTVLPAVPTSVANLDYTFQSTGIAQADDIVVPSGVTSMTGTFQDCINLTHVPDLPEWVTVLNGTFRGCTALTSVPDIPVCRTNIDNLYRNCTGLTQAPQIMEEERRLAFVAATRAERKLYFSDSEGRNLDGSFRYPSRFLLNIDKNLLTWINEPDEGLMKRAVREIGWKERSLPSADEVLLPVGSRVKHNVFGEGTIRGIDDKNRAYAVRFDRFDTDRNIRFGYWKQAAAEMKEKN